MRLAEQQRAVVQFNEIVWDYRHMNPAVANKEDVTSKCNDQDFHNRAEFFPTSLVLLLL